MKLESNFKNMVLVLTIISLIAAGVLGSVYQVTEEPIAKAKAEKQQNAIKQVLGDFDRLEEEVVDGITLYKGYIADEFVGAAVEASSNGFSGEVKIMVGFDKDGNILDYAVLQQAETPGLGTKMVDWFKTDKGNQNIKGKNPGKKELKVSKDGGDVDAITAATISSRAFLGAVNKAYAAYSGGDVNAVSGACNVQSQSTDSVACDSQQSVVADSAAVITDSINVIND